MEKTFKIDVLKITKGGCQNTYHKTVKAENFIDALIKLKLGVKTFGEGGKYMAGLCYDGNGGVSPTGINLGGRVFRYVNGEDIPVDTGDL